MFVMLNVLYYTPHMLFGFYVISSQAQQSSTFRIVILPQMKKAMRMTTMTMKMRMKKMNHIAGSLIVISFIILGLLRRSEGAGEGTEEGAVLQSLFNSNDGFIDAFHHLDWSSSSTSSHCKWKGVACDNASSTVISLDLHSSNLTGTIPDRISLLSSLRFINLSDNAITGPLPSTVTSLINLQTLDVAGNLLSNAFPEEIPKLQNLTFLRAYNNNFTGPLPTDIAKIPKLQFLDLAGNYFYGRIPASYGSMKNLKTLRLSGNSLTGAIPEELGNLTRLEVLELGYNSFTGGIPEAFGRMKEIRYLSMVQCNLSGIIPPHLGNLTKCNSLFLFQNRLTGAIPSQLGDMISLMSFDVSDNQLTGEIPQSFSKLNNLTLLSLMINSFSGNLPSFIGDLPNLQVIKIFTNFFTGSLPPNLGSAKGLQWIDASSNHLNGTIPNSICNGGSLIKLEFFENDLTGEIPNLSNCTNLLRVRLHQNKLTGTVPGIFGSMKNLSKLELSENLLEGAIPIELAYSPSLSSINLSNNKLIGSVPESLFELPQLRELFLSGNDITSSIPIEIDSARNLQKLDLSDNVITGSIPDQIGGCKQLISLNLHGNRISGNIPPALASLPVLATVDLSGNMLTGGIPTVFQNSTTLETFNVSYNYLSGPLPSDGVFRTQNPSAFDGNPELCGGSLPIRCGGEYSKNLPPFGDKDSSSSFKQSVKFQRWIIGLVVSAAAVSFLVVALKCRSLERRRRRRSNGVSASSSDGVGSGGEWKMTAFQRLGYGAYDVLECLKESNVIGKGAAGIVYKAQMRSGDVVAVKKLINPPRSSSSDRLNQRCEEEALQEDRGFFAEVNLLGSIRHRNIVRLLGCCSNQAQRSNLLIYEYMPNGSLGDALHGKDAPNILTDWVTRYDIACGVAQGLCYLHHDCFPQIVHRDVKSTNILLDSNMEARVADFGVAKLIQCHNQPMSVIAGSYGYIAPEYAYTMRVDERGDVYSYGVVLMELVTGKRPVEPEYGESVNIVEWVRERIVTGKGHSGVLDVSIAGASESVEEEMLLVLRIALLCTSKLPRERPTMRDVVGMLSEARPRRKKPSITISSAFDSPTCK